MISIYCYEKWKSTCPELYCAHFCYFFYVPMIFLRDFVAPYKAFLFCFHWVCGIQLKLCFFFFCFCREWRKQISPLQVEKLFCKWCWKGSIFKHFSGLGKIHNYERNIKKHKIGWESKWVDCNYFIFKIIRTFIFYYYIYFLL